MTSTEKLLAALEEAQAPADMIIRARCEVYNDFLSLSMHPLGDLVRDLRLAGLEALAERAMDGEFDATKEESDAWIRSMADHPTVGPLLKLLLPHEEEPREDREV